MTGTMHDLDRLVDDWRGATARTLAAEHLPGLGLAVAVGEEVVWAEGFGMADPGRSVATSPDTAFRCASITKLFTACGVMCLRDEGALSLDDPVRRFVPELPSDRTTIRQILCHGSGLQRETPDDPGWTTGSFVEGAEFLEAIGRATFPLPPMEHWKYSNLGYNVLGVLISRASGQSYEGFIRSRVIEPLGLRRTTFDPSELPEGSLAYGHERVPDQDAVRSDPRTHERVPAPAGQLFSTAPDLALFAAFLGGARSDGPLSSDTLAEMRRPRIVADDRWEAAHGLGPMLVRDGDLILAGHAGEVGGFSGWILAEPTAQVAAVALTNLADAAAVRPLAIELVRGAAATLVTAPGPPVPPPPEIGALMGRYFGDGMLMSLGWREGALVAGWPGRPGSLGSTTTLHPEGEAAFRFGPSGPYAGETLTIERTSDGRVSGFEVCTYRFQRV